MYMSEVAGEMIALLRQNGLNVTYGTIEFTDAPRSPYAQLNIVCVDWEADAQTIIQRYWAIINRLINVESGSEDEIFPYQKGWHFELFIEVNVDHWRR